MRHKMNVHKTPASCGTPAIMPESPSFDAQNTEWTGTAPDECVEIEENTPEIKALQAHPQLREDYDVLRLIGRGAQGAVYLARQRETETLVAIKALSFREISDWKASDLFMREIALLKSMHIEGTPRYIDAIDATASPQPYYFLVQDFIPGESLQVKLDRGEKLSTQEVIAIALAIIPILEKLRTYSPPIVHRDIKPSNIMMTPQGDIYLIDFGAAMFSERCTGGSTFAGTAGYMAPEQCMGTSTPGSDVYGLGATLIHLLTGVAPYKMQVQRAFAIVPKKKKRSFSTVLRKPFIVLTDAIRRLWGLERKKRTPQFPCSMMLPFKPYLPKETPQWLAELLEIMVSPYPDQRVKDLDLLVHAIRTISGIELEGHSVHVDAAAQLESMKAIKYQHTIPTIFLVLPQAFPIWWIVAFVAMIHKLSILPFINYSDYATPFIVISFTLIGFTVLFLHRTLNIIFNKKNAAFNAEFERFQKEKK